MFIILLSKTAIVRWNARNKSHYIGAGYHFTKCGDNLEVSVEDLTCGSTAIVEVECDYCGLKYSMMWQTYVAIHRRSELNKDACRQCGHIKCKETIDTKYDSYAGLALSCSDKRAKTNLAKYGVENVFSNEAIKKKIISTNIKKYGVPYSQQCEDVRKKTRQTCREKYGVDNYIELFKGKFIKENSPSWKGGVKQSRVERATYEYNEWRKIVFTRDKYRCQKCGDKSGEGHTVELCAHHILNWKDNPDYRYNPDNGITLCDKCHNAFHSRYGKRNNTQEQLLEFLQELDEEIC